MSTVYMLTLRQLAGRWRLLIMTALAMMPILIALAMLGSSNAPTVAEFESVVLSAMLAGSIAPLVVLAIAAAAFGNELEDRTIANLTLAPLPRWRIAVPKLLAVLSIAVPFIAVSAAVTGHIAFLGDARATLAITASAVVGVALYSAAFVWLGLMSTQAIGIGLLYIVIWEGFFSGFVAGVRMLSIRHYAVAVMHGIDPRRFAGPNQPSLLAALVVATLVFALFVHLSVRRLRRMDVP